ncbi:MAG: hypothetical protein ACQGVK_09765 [Myxococcota bacterium]
MSLERSKIALATTAALLIAFAGLGIQSALDWHGRTYPGFLVLENGVVASVGLSDWPATRGGEIFQHTVVAVDGAPVTGSAELRQALRHHTPGSTVELRFSSNGHEFERPIAMREFNLQDGALIFGAYLLNGLLLGGIALHLLGRKDLDSRTTWAATPFLVLGALWGLSAMDLYGPHLLFRAHVFCESLIFAAAVHMAIAFPTPLLSERLTRRVVAATYGVGALIAVAYQWLLHAPAAYAVIHLLATTLAGIAMLLVVVALLNRYLHSSPIDGRASLGVLAGGAVVALVLPVLLTLPELMTGGTAPQNAVGWTIFLFPATVGYAMRRGTCSSLSAPAASGR